MLEQYRLLFPFLLSLGDITTVVAHYGQSWGTPVEHHRPTSVCSYQCSISLIIRFLLHQSSFFPALTVDFFFWLPWLFSFKKYLQALSSSHPGTLLLVSLPALFDTQHFWRTITKWCRLSSLQVHARTATATEPECSLLSFICSLLFCVQSCPVTPPIPLLIPTCSHLMTSCFQWQYRIEVKNGDSPSRLGSGLGSAIYFVRLHK